MSFDVVTFVNQPVGLLTGAATDQSVTWAKESQFAIQAFQKNDFLAKTAMANPTSAQNAIINVAAIGITLNPAAKLAYLVPRDGGVHLDISYMGLLHLAQVSGAIQWGQCRLVHANDTYESNGLDKAPTHKYNAFGERGPVVGGYCTVKTQQGDYLTDEMSLAEIKQVENTSKAKNGPWKNWWEEMARKTIVKRAAKYWPRVERVDNAIHHLNDDEGIEMEPVMPHKPEAEVAAEAAERFSRMESLALDLIEGMRQSDNMEELKDLFGKAYTMTKGTKLQSSVQAEYAKKKQQLEGVI